jgi:hypothetical protein
MDMMIVEKFPTVLDFSVNFVATSDYFSFKSSDHVPITSNAV